MAAPCRTRLSRAQKFVGAGREDSCYIKCFFIGMPIPTKLGWLAWRAPLPVHQLALFVMFLTEMPLPFCVFWPGGARVQVAIHIIF